MKQQNRISNNFYSQQGRKSESGSNGSDQNGNSVQELSRILTSTLSKSETFAARTNLVEDLSVALSMIALPTAEAAAGVTNSADELDGNNGTLMLAQKKQNEQNPDDDEANENGMMKPNFRLGAFTYGYGVGASKLGSLAALANYNSEKEGELSVCFVSIDVESI